MNITRRTLVTAFPTAGLFATAIASRLCLPRNALAAWTRVVEERHIATNTYPWSTFARRDKTTYPLHSPKLLGEIAATGITGYEPIIQHPREFEGLQAELPQHGLEMRSLYVNSTLHDKQQAPSSIEHVLSIASAAQKLGTRIVVTNPSPIRWGGTEDKSDEQLRVQARSLDELGRRLNDLGMQLAYHNHDAELRQGGREFHHMLTATNPAHVKLCLDAHWVFRGCGNSEVAVFDALTHYHERIVELHLRQSTQGIWNESFQMNGDIDYVRMFEFLADRDILPHLVLEQAVEAKTPHTRTATQAHQASHAELLKSLPS